MKLIVMFPLNIDLGGGGGRDVRELCEIMQKIEKNIEET